MKNRKRSLFLPIFGIVVVFFITISHSAPPGSVRATEESPGLEAFLKQSWKNFVQLMSIGIPDLNIPTFDPWYSPENFPFRVQDMNYYLMVDVNATSVESVGFSSVETKDVVSSGPDSSTYNMSLFLPDLKVEGSYSAVGNSYIFLPIFGLGKFTIICNSAKTTASSTINHSGFVTSLSTIELGVLKCRSRFPSFENLSVPGSDSSLLSKVAILMAEKLWSEVEEDLRGQLSTALTNYLNEQLEDYSPSFWKRDFVSRN